MASFVPPTDEYGQMDERKHPLNRLMAHYGTMPRGRNVFYLSDGTVTETDPDSTTVFWRSDQGSPYVVQTWWGAPAEPYDVTTEQANALVAAGYTVT